jgi:predicted GIY-YIG superfamily endonuclease
MNTSLNASALDTRFHAVYLLTSCDPRYKLHYYVGYTTNPLRRLKQHNGELGNGAWRTARKGRPWRIVLFVAGFTEDRAGLRFEWMWQNPHRTVALRDEVEKLKLVRLPFAVAILHLLLQSSEFSNMALSLNVLDEPTYNQVKGAAAAAGIRPPVASALLQLRAVTEAEVEHMVLHADDDDDNDAVAGGTLTQIPVTHNDSLPMQSQHALSIHASSASRTPTPTRGVDHQHPLDRDSWEADIAATATRNAYLDANNLVPCTLCCLSAPLHISFRCTQTRDCPMRCHVACLAMWFYAHCPPAERPEQQSLAEPLDYAAGDALPPPLPSLVPANPAPCPVCAEALYWPVLIQRLRMRLNKRDAEVIEGRRAMFEQRLALLRALEASGGRGRRAKRTSNDRPETKRDEGGRNTGKTKASTSTRRADRESHLLLPPSPASNFVSRAGSGGGMILSSPPQQFATPVRSTTSPRLVAADDDDWLLRM